MLPSAFYTFNATTQLLWLFQTVSHEILLLLIILGVVCLCSTICIVVFRVVKVSVDIAIAIARVSAKYMLFRYVARRLPQSLDEPNAIDNPIDRNTILDNVVNRALENIDISLQPRGLSLPQVLALHPERWSQIESNHAVNNAVSSTSTAGQVATPAPTAESSCSVVSPETVVLRPTLRRSRRVPRARAMFSD